MRRVLTGRVSTSSSGGSARTGSTRAVRARRAGIAAGIAASAVLLSGCTANEAFFFGLPDPATKEAPIIQNLWQGAWIAAWGVGIVTWALMIWAAVAYRRRHKDDVPEQTAYNIPLEILYTLVPLVMIIGLFTFTAKDQSEILAVSNDQDLTVNVVGYRWSWGFNYLDDDVYSSGMPIGQNADTNIPTLVLPVNEKVRFELTSPDVIHSFWVPDFLFKMDVIPGKTNVFELTPNKIGTFAGKCAELCGVDHSRMLFQVKVVERAEYDAYIQSLRDAGQTGLLVTNQTNDHGKMPNERTT